MEIYNLTKWHEILTMYLFKVLAVIQESALNLYSNTLFY